MLFRSKVSGTNGEAVLYFDVASGLLVRSKRRMPNPLTGKEVDTVGDYQDYKTVGGIRYPMKLVSFMDGKKTFELEITEIKFLSKIADKVFEKP